MKRPLRIAAILASVGALACAACSREAEHEKDEKDEKAPAAAPSVTFKAGRGLQVSAATLASLNLKTAPAEERALATESRLVAQVYDAGPPARASVFVSAAEADRVASGQPANATLERTVRSLEATTHQVELIFALASSPAPKVGDFVAVTVRQPETKALAVPRAAVIDGAAGAFVYVVNADFYLRTAIKTGAADADWIEITDGLYAGDIVVTQGARKLWLAEMLLTKGGGDID